MPHKSLDVYLNDHLAGATVGCDLAEQLQTQTAGTPLGEVMATLAPQIKQDRQTLVDLMERLGTGKSQLKQATAWLVEKASRPKFSGMTSGDRELGTFMALESLLLGVAGKACLWRALKEVASAHASLSNVGLDALLEQAQAQQTVLEGERRAAAKRALTFCRPTHLMGAHATKRGETLLKARGDLLVRTSESGAPDHLSMNLDVVRSTAVAVAEGFGGR